jgi:hypothetical protein
VRKIDRHQRHPARNQIGPHREHLDAQAGRGMSGEATSSEEASQAKTNARRAVTALARPLPKLGEADSNQLLDERPGQGSGGP